MSLFPGKPNQYITPSEIDTFHTIGVCRNGIFLFPNGTDPTPLVFDKQLQPTDACKEAMRGREQFVSAIQSYLQKIVR
jgi:hypothetical protein